MAKKRLVLALGHDALGTNLPEQKTAVTKTAKAIADFIQDGWQVVITHGNTPQLGMIHTALNEFAKNHEGYTPAPMSVCSAMSQGYIGYDLQNALRSELIKRGIYKAVSTILTQVTVDPYDESSYTPMKVVGRVMNAEEAKEEEEKGNFVVKEGDGYRRIVAAPKPVAIVEIDAIRALADADQPVIAAGGGGIPVMEQGSNLKGASAVIEKDRAAGLLCHGLRLGAGAAGHTHQLVVRQKALPVGIRHDAAQKTAAHDAKFCFHSTNLLFLSSLRMQNTKLSIPCSVWKEKRSAAFLLRGSVLK